MNLLLSAFCISLLSTVLFSANNTTTDYCVPLTHTNNEVKNICEKNNKPYLLIEYFSTNCRYCQRNVEPFKILEEGLREIASSRLVTSNSLQAVETFARANNIQTPIALDPNRITERAFNLRGYPTMFILDSNNQIIFTQVGALTTQKINEIYEFLKNR